MELTATDVRSIAADFGVELSQDEAHEYVERTRAVVDSMASYAPTDTSVTTPDTVTEGKDEYNAFRYKFELEEGSGPLDGVCGAVKDNISVAGVPMTCGSETLEFTPPYHATVVQRLLDAGAQLVGTTNMDEYALYSTGETCQHGPTRNPTVPDGVPGGSSSGSGAAVAGGLVDVALGSDAGGSIRIPASFCGVVGFKPTHRTVPRFGYVDLAPSIDHVGPLARDVETACRTLETINGWDLRDPSTYRSRAPTGLTEAAEASPEGLTVGLVSNALELSDPAVAETVRTATESLTEQDVAIETVSIEYYEDAAFVLPRISGPEFATLMRHAGHVYATGTGYSEAWRAAVAAANDTGGYGANVRERLIANRSLVEATDGEAYVRAKIAGRQLLEAVRDTFETVDALVTPTTAITAPEFGEITSREDVQRTIANTAPFNLTGHPALSVPCGEVDGRPVGFQIVTQWGREGTAATVGASVEAS